MARRNRKRSSPAPQQNGELVRYQRPSMQAQTLEQLKQMGIEVRPMQKPDGKRDSGQPVPQIVTFAGFAGQLGKVYRNPDEAWRDSRENARHMRKDPAIMECLDARQLSVALFPWHLDTGGDKSDTARELASSMTAILRKVPRFTEYRRSMQDAIWYGRQGMQHNIGDARLKGRRIRTLVADRQDPAWSPINGDKLAFPYDRQGLGIRVGWAWEGHGESRNYANYKQSDPQGKEMDHFWDARAQRYRRIEIVSEYGRVYWLDEDEEQRVSVHKHFIEDADFETPLQAGRVHGVGIRDRIYWTWFVKQSTAALLMEYLERSALGFEIWTYPMNNKDALTALQAAAETRSGFGKNIVFVPVIPGQEGLMDFQHQEIQMSGMELFNSLIHEYYEWQIKRLILGQVQSTEPVGGGLGTAGLSDLQGKSLRSILLYDSTNLEETITGGLLAMLRRENRHVLPLNSDGIELYFRIDAAADSSKEIMESIERAYNMGAPIRTESIYQAAGLEKPTDDDEVVAAQGAPKTLQEHREQVQGSGPLGPQAGPEQAGEGGQPASGQPGQDEENPEENSPENVQPTSGGPDRATMQYSLRGEISRAVRATDPNPTEAQRKSGNYRKGRFMLHGMPVSIETSKGVRRRPQWPPMGAHYGYIRGTESEADQDHIDVFIGPDPESEIAFVVDQVKADGTTFDEHKVLLGFHTREEALKAYRRSYTKDWIVGPVTAMTVDQLKAWIAGGVTHKPVAEQVSRYKSNGWVTMGAHGDPPKGGARVYLEDGKITKGPKALAGKKASQVSKKKPDRFDDLEDVDPYKPPPESKAGKRKNRVVVNYDALFAQETANAAKRLKVDKRKLRDAVQELWQEEQDRVNAREQAKVELRSKFEPAELAAIRKRYDDGGDFTKQYNWDLFTRAWVNEHPDDPEMRKFASDPESTEAQQALWDMLNERRVLPTPKHDPDLVNRAAQDLKQREKADKRRAQERTQEDDNWDSFNDPDHQDFLAARKGQPSAEAVPFRRRGPVQRGPQP